LFPSRFRQQPHLSTRQYARIVHRWVERAVLIVRPTAPIRCAERRRLKFIGRPATCEPCSCCSATPSWTISRTGLCPVQPGEEHRTVC
jgi:hypothetical protein